MVVNRSMTLSASGVALEMNIDVSGKREALNDFSNLPGAIAFFSEDDERKNCYFALLVISRDLRVEGADEVGQYVFAATVECVDRAGAVESPEPLAGSWDPASFER